MEQPIMEPVRERRLSPPPAVRRDVRVQAARLVSGQTVFALVYLLGCLLPFATFWMGSRSIVYSVYLLPLSMMPQMMVYPLFLLLIVFLGQCSDTLRRSRDWICALVSAVNLVFLFATLETVRLSVAHGQFTALENVTAVSMHVGYYALFALTILHLTAFCVMWRLRRMAAAEKRGISA